MFHGHLLGLYEKALPAEWSWERRLSAARELGFDYMEISIDETDGRMARLWWSRAERKALRELTDRLDMPIRSMCLSAHRRFPFGSADASVRGKARELAEKAVQFADDLGIRVIQLAGYDVYYEPPTNRSAAAFLEGMEYVARLGERYQVMHAMEIMDTPFMNSITKHLWYEERIRSPYYRVYPDLGNLTAWGNDIAAELKKGIASIVAIHLKETRPVPASSAACRWGRGRWISPGRSAFCGRWGIRDLSCSKCGRGPHPTTVRRSRVRGRCSKRPTNVRCGLELFIS